MSGYFTGVREQWEPLYEHLRRMAIERLGEFEENVTKSGILWKHSTTFAEVSAKAACMVVGIPSDQLREEWEPSKYLQTSKYRYAHYFEVTNTDSFPELIDRIEAAYKLTNTGRAKPTRQKLEYSTVDEYIALFPMEVQQILHATRQTIRENAPDAKEIISWQMPTYHQHENLVHFAAAKTHLGFYPAPESVEFFESRLTEYKHSKGTIQFPFDKPIPYDLIADIVRFRVAMVEGKR